ncbi:hypothetical protein BEWA_023170 [Theileria equi strain WA]|uniref:Uncharacterized protein n=1 Tax=Theileria equi strain WA TaxID=1537102 RepID=L0AW62_THEEQ|nr:hypothetical protein BEWA_023170 [Theileria equi strain WA]AFZ79468.1 hypothetical protein BEWA_023170 [Theileria equi strain WA]|eukprot:XP_004829134.1 hypothetical protein BEWA_023170 [Theileria equi strain WA]
MSRNKQELRFLFILGTKSLQDGRNMSILVIFYALFLSIVCSSTDSRGGGSNGYTEPLVSKIDGSKYSTSVLEKDGVPILKLEAKEGMVVTELKYGGETIWDGDGEVEILSTLIYFSDDRPEVVTLKCRENGRDRTLILHKDGKKWKESKEEHERKLKELQVTKKHVEVKAKEAKTAAKEITVVATTEAVFTSTNSAGNAFRKKTVSGDIQVGNDLVGDTSRGARVEDEESTEPSLGGTEEDEQDEYEDEDNDSDEEDEEPETTEENEVKDNEPEEPKEFEDEDEDPEFHDGFWDTPDDYSERQDDTQDEPDGLVIDDEEEDPEEAYEDDSLKSAPETPTKSRTRSEEGTIGGLEQGHPKESEDNDLGEEDEDEAEESENSSSGPITMDVANLCSQNYKHVDYVYDNNYIRLFLPNEGMIIAKLIDGENSIWEAKSDEKFEFAKVYLNKDGKAEVMLVTKNTPSGVKCKYYTKTWTGWRESKDIGDRVPKLKVFAQQKSDFNIDLSLETSTTECTIFEAELLGVTTKHFYPKLGYIAKEVMYNGATLWKSTNGNEKCIGCELYLRGHGRPLLAITIKGRTKDYKFFEKEGSRWVPIKNEEFSEKLERMKIAKGESLKDFYETNEPEGQDMNVPEPQGGEAEEEEDEPPSQEVNMTRNYSRSTGGSSDRVYTSPSEVDRLPNSSREVKRKITKDREVKDIPVEVENYTIRRKTSTPTIHKETEETIRAQRVPANHVNNNAQMQKNINCRETSNYNEDKNIQPKQVAFSNSQNFDVNRINCIGSSEGETEGEMKIKTLKVNSPVPQSDEHSILTTWSNGDPTLLNLALQQPPSTEWYLEKINEKWNDVTGRVFEEELRVLKRDHEHAAPITLDLANPNKSQITVQTGNYSGVEYKGYFPKRGHYFSSFSNDGSPIWTISRGERCFLAQSFTNESLALFTLVSDFGRKYFEKAGGIWKSLNRGDFFNKLYGMGKSEEPAVQPTSLSDLKSKVDSTLFYVESGEENYVTVLKLKAKEDKNPTKLVYGGETIWDGEGKVEVLSTLIYLDGDQPELLTLHHWEKGREGILFLHNTGNKWQVVQKEDYEKLLEDLKNKGKLGDLVTLNLVNPDESNIDTDEYTESGLSFKAYTPKNGYHISSVMDGQVYVWKAKAGERCTLVESYIEGDSTLISIVINGSDYGLYLKYFEKVNGEWKNLTQGDFFKKLNGMKRFGLVYERRILLSSKVDTKSFDVKVSNYNGVPVLQCNAKSGLFVYNLKCGNDIIWKGFDGAVCISALIYFKGNKPYIVTLQSRKNGEDRILFLHYNGCKWEHNKREHERKLNTLKETYRNIRLKEGILRKSTIIPSAGQYNFDSRVQNSQRSDKSTNTDNLEDQLEWTDLVGALRGGNQYIAYDTDIMSMSRERELFGKMDYTDSRDLFNTQWYSEDRPIEQFYLDPMDNFTYYPPNFMVPDKDSCTRCAMERMITPLFFPEFQSDTVINVSKYNPTFYNIYDYYFDDVITRLIVPWYWTEITSLSHGGKAIWMAHEGESLVYATVHLRDTMPILVYILKDCTSANKTETLLRTNNGWRLIGNYPGAFKSIPRPNVVKFHCTIDLTCPDHGRVKVFDTVIGGLKTRFFIPRLGFRAYKIAHNGAVIWRSPEYEYSGKESQWRAIIVRAYLRGNSCFLVKATLNTTYGSLSSINYIYLNGRWIEIDERESERAKWALKAYVDPQE